MPAHLEAAQRPGRLSAFGPYRLLWALGAILGVPHLDYAIEARLVEAVVHSQSAGYWLLQCSVRTQHGLIGAHSVECVASKFRRVAAKFNRHSKLARASRSCASYVQHGSNASRRAAKSSPT